MVKYASKIFSHGMLKGGGIHQYTTTPWILPKYVVLIFGQILHNA